MFNRNSLVVCLFVVACNGSSSSTSDAPAASGDVQACDAVGSAYCARAYACLSADQLVQYQLPATQAECVDQENANCGSATPEPGFCKGAAQTSAQAATACAADLNGTSCSDFTQPASGSDVCKTELCAS
ncbi:MAG TPA: hypothetical protein VH143_02355 [Kofleriaceae bacterium]|jgi:hypothetical protein|nr:hypothetical protein [Kofleriaceae bacterium]